MIDFIVGLFTGIPASVELIAAGILIVAGIFDTMMRTYATYILTNPATGQKYIGRTSGYGEVEAIIRKRLYGHKYYKQGFTIIKLDKAMQGRSGKLAIRGREQQLIDHYGGIGHFTIANKIRAVAKFNWRRQKYYDLSNKYFGQLTNY